MLFDLARSTTDRLFGMSVYPQQVMFFTWH